MAWLMFDAANPGRVRTDRAAGRWDLPDLDVLLTRQAGRLAGKGAERAQAQPVALRQISSNSRVRGVGVAEVLPTTY
jgi:hypothetical protein